jgi:hypothetical protein
MRNANTLKTALANINTDLPVVSIQREFNIDESFATVVLSHPKQTFDFDGLNKSVLKMTKNRVYVVENSVCQLDKEMTKAIVGKNLINKAYTEDNLKGMKAVTANVFADEEDSIWQLIGEGEEKRLVQTSTDNISNILAVRKAKMQTTASVLVDPRDHYRSFDYSWYFNNEKQECRGGFVMELENRTVVLDRKNFDVKTIQPQQVISSADVSPDLGKIAIAGLSNENISRHLEYMRKLYGQNPEYFSKLESLIRNSMSPDSFDTRRA